MGSRPSHPARPPNGCFRIWCMGNPLVAGRAFAWTDIQQLKPIVVISKNLAREVLGRAVKGARRGGSDRLAASIQRWRPHARPTRRTGSAIGCLTRCGPWNGIPGGNVRQRPRAALWLRHRAGPAAARVPTAHSRLPHARMESRPRTAGTSASQERAGGRATRLRH